MISRSATIYTSIVEFYPGPEISTGLSLTLGIRPGPLTFTFHLVSGTLRLAAQGQRPTRTDYALIRHIFEPAFWALRAEFLRLRSELLAAPVPFRLVPTLATYSGYTGHLQIGFAAPRSRGSDWLNLQSVSPQDFALHWSSFAKSKPPLRTDYVRSSSYQAALVRWSLRFGSETTIQLRSVLGPIVLDAQQRFNAILPAGIIIPV
jgi:hypothetical protein